MNLIIYSSSSLLFPPGGGEIRGERRIEKLPMENGEEKKIKFCSSI